MGSILIETFVLDTTRTLESSRTKVTIKLIGYSVIESIPEALARSCADLGNHGYRHLIPFGVFKKNLGGAGFGFQAVGQLAQIGPVIPT
jgi:hypothetical protein